MLDGLFFVATSDGVVTPDELGLSAAGLELFGQGPLTFRRLKATHLGLEKEDPYAVLGAVHDAADAEVRAAWKAQLSEAHPDRARGPRPAIRVHRGRRGQGRGDQRRLRHLCASGRALALQGAA